MVMIPGLDELHRTLRKELLRHEERASRALNSWRRSGNRQEWEEAYCGAMCIYAVAESHAALDQTPSSARARIKVAQFGERWAKELVDELDSKP